MVICHNVTNGSECLTENRDGARYCARCGGKLQIFITQNYRVIDVIGSGGTGVIYKVAYVKSGGFLVVKSFNSTEKNVIEAVQFEFDVIRNLNHPGIPKYLEFIIYDNKPHIVMEFIPGQNLLDLILREPIDEKQVLLYADQICAILDYLHNLPNPVTHRDIKPENIILTPAGDIKIVDFGIMKQGHGRTLDVNRALTENYAPLEQWDRRPGGTNHLSDIYSLGATLYHLTTGFAPVSSLNRSSSLSRSNIDTLIAPNARNKHISLHLSNVILKAMSLRPEDRYRSISLLRETLLRKTTNDGRTVRMSQSNSFTPPKVQPPYTIEEIGPRPSNNPRSNISSTPPAVPPEYIKEYIKQFKDKDPK